MDEWEILTLIHHDPVHLGDTEDAKWPKLEGSRWSVAFLHRHQASDTLYLLASVFESGSPENHISINGHSVGRLPVNRGKSYEDAVLEIPDGALRQGANELVVEAGAPAGRTDLDDFLIRNLRIGRRTGETDTGDGGTGGRDARLSLLGRPE